MKPFAVGEHHRGPGVAGLSGRLEVFEGEGERGREAGVFGQSPGEGIILAFIRDDHADFLFPNQGEQFGEVVGGGVSRFGGASGKNRPSNRQPVVMGK